MMGQYSTFEYALFAIQHIATNKWLHIETKVHRALSILHKVTQLLLLYPFLIVKFTNAILIMERQWTDLTHI